MWQLLKKSCSGELLMALFAEMHRCIEYLLTHNCVAIAQLDKLKCKGLFNPAFSLRA